MHDARAVVQRGQQFHGGVGELGLAHRLLAAVTQPVHVQPGDQAAFVAADPQGLGHAVAQLFGQPLLQQLQALGLAGKKQREHVAHQLAGALFGGDRVEIGEAGVDAAEHALDGGHALGDAEAFGLVLVAGQRDVVSAAFAVFVGADQLGLAGDEVEGPRGEAGDADAQRGVPQVAHRALDDEAVGVVVRLFDLRELAGVGVEAGEAAAPAQAVEQLAGLVWLAGAGQSQVDQPVLHVVAGASDLASAGLADQALLQEPLDPAVAGGVAAVHGLFLTQRGGEGEVLQHAGKALGDTRRRRSCRGFFVHPGRRLAAAAGSVAIRPARGRRRAAGLPSRYRPNRAAGRGAG